MRIQVEVPKAKAEEMRSLMELGGLKTYYDLLNNALSLLKWAVQETQQRRIIQSESEDGQQKSKLVMPYLMEVAAKLPPLQKKAAIPSAVMGASGQ
jgi:hypothetical protein